MIDSEITSKINFKNVSKSFDHNSNSEMILEDISFDIYSNEFVCILGPSGSGKSTILGLIAGFIKSDTGELLFNQKKINRPDSSRTLVFQDYALFPWLNIIDNVGFGLTTKLKDKALIREKASEYLNLVGLSDYKDHTVSQLSGGMKQRVAIARALCAEPEVLLLDEPFGALDQQTRENMQNEILRLWLKSKRTVVFVTHSVDEAIKLADRIIVIGGKPGKVLLNTTIPISRPRSFNDMELSKYRQLIIDKISSPEMAFGEGI